MKIYDLYLQQAEEGKTRLLKKCRLIIIVITIATMIESFFNVLNVDLKAFVETMSLLVVISIIPSLVAFLNLDNYSTETGWEKIVSIIFFWVFTTPIMMAIGLLLGVMLYFCSTGLIMIFNPIMPLKAKLFIGSIILLFGALLAIIKFILGINFNRR